MTDTRTRILDLAERQMRLRGYHAVSFRDLADELGVKSASIHYHFRHKEDLGVAVVDRYAMTFAKALGDAGDLDWVVSVARFCGAYREALVTSNLQCLCSMFAAETLGLPCQVAKCVAAFFNANIAWLIASMPPCVTDKRACALRIQSELQGAMALSVSLHDNTILETVAVAICADARQAVQP